MKVRGLSVDKAKNIDTHGNCEGEQIPPRSSEQNRNAADAVQYAAHKALSPIRGERAFVV